MIEIDKLSRPDLEHIWANIRDHDRRELKLFGYPDAVPLAHLDQRVALVGRVDGVPVITFGLYEGERTVVVWAFATPEITKYWKSATQGARALLDWAQVEYPDRPILALVWDGHDASKRWLGRMGFEPTKHRFRRDGEGMTWMELRG